MDLFFARYTSPLINILGESRVLKDILLILMVSIYKGGKNITPHTEGAEFILFWSLYFPNVSCAEQAINSPRVCAQAFYTSFFVPIYLSLSRTKK